MKAIILLLCYQIVLGDGGDTQISLEYNLFNSFFKFASLKCQNSTDLFMPYLVHKVLPLMRMFGNIDLF